MYYLFIQNTAPVDQQNMITNTINYYKNIILSTNEKIDKYNKYKQLFEYDIKSLMNNSKILISIINNINYQFNLLKKNVLESMKLINKHETIIKNDQITLKKIQKELD